MKSIINYKGVHFEVDYTYQPYEKPTRDYPGMGESVEEINSITHQGVEFWDILEDQFDEISEVIINDINKEEYI